jgi:hypothetical protein
MRGWLGCRGDCGGTFTGNGTRTCAAAAFALAALVALPSQPSAHDIPVAVVVHAFVRPAGQAVQVLVRVPIGAMRDIEFPTRGPGFLDFARADSALRAAAARWIARDIELYEQGVLLAGQRLSAVRVALPSDRSFASWDEALAHVTGRPLPEDTELYWDQGMLDVLFEYPIRSERSDFAIRLGLERLGLRVTSVVRFVTPGGSVRAFEYSGDAGIVHLDPRWSHAAQRFLALGFRHILDGTDHLLFLFCLVIPVGSVRKLILLVTAFTLAHSATLIAAATGVVPGGSWFPPLVETLIAMSIVYMALENVVTALPGAGRPDPRTPTPDGPAGWVASAMRRRWMITLVFGLVHGFGFSFALQDTLQFAGSHLTTSLLAFNIGVELGQLLVLLFLVPLLHAVFRFVSPRAGVIVLSALAAHTAWHWMEERAGRLSEAAWPAWDAAVLAGAARWLMIAVIVAGIVWFAAAMRQGAEGRTTSSAEHEV